MSAPGRATVASVGGNAGLIEAKKRWQTQLVVSIYDAALAGLDTGRDPYAVVCEDHGSILAQPTLTRARTWAQDPRAWCDECRPAR